MALSTQASRSDTSSRPLTGAAGIIVSRQTGKVISRRFHKFFNGTAY